MKKLLIISLLFIIGCSDGKQTASSVTSLPKINAETETSITVWAWNVAAKGLTTTIPSFNEKYPNIKVEIVEFGNPPNVLERLGVVFNSGTGVPDVFAIETDFVQTIAETYPHRLVDLNPYITEGWENTMDPSKIPMSYDLEGRLVSIPWDSGPVVLFYNTEYFQQAGIDAESINTWEDYIVAGKKLQTVLPNVKMTGFHYTADDGPWRIFMNQANTYYLNTNDQITLGQTKAAEALSLVRYMINEGIVLDTVNWSGFIQSLKTGTVASYFMGGWWAGTMRDQAPEQSGKWRIIKIPAQTPQGVRAASQGGSTLMVSATTPITQAASIEFLKHALMTVDEQYRMFSQYGLFPSYMPVYNDTRFKEGDPYFNGQDINSLMGEVVQTTPPSIYNSAQYSEIRNIAISAFDKAVNSQEEIQQILADTVAQVQSSTGKEIAQ